MLAFLTGVLILGSSSVAGGRPDPRADVIDLAAARRAGLTQYWEARLPIGRADSIRRTYLVDDALYVTTVGGSMFALTADAGLIRWGIALTEPDYTIYRPAHVLTCGAEYVIIPTTPQVLILDRYSGEIVRTFTTDFAAGSPAVGVGNWLFMGSADGHFYSVAWYLRDSMPDSIRWKVRVGAPVTAAPVLYGEDKLLFASQSGTVFSCRAADKTFNWAFCIGGAILGDLAIDDSGVYVASSDRSLYKLDAENGSQIWRFRTASPLRDGPAVTSHTVYQHCPDHGLVAVDAYTGREKWRVDKGRAFVAHTQGRTAVLTDDRYLQLVDQETGKVQHAIDAGEFTSAVTNVHDDAIYLLHRNGRVLCLRPSGVPYLRPAQVTAARDRLTVSPSAAANSIEPLTAESHLRVDPLENDPLRSRHDLGGP